MKKTAIKRKVPLRKCNKPRQNKEFLRAYHSDAFVRFTRESKSVVSGHTPCVCAHVTPNSDGPSGMGRKPDAKWVVPLTDAEHKELHQHGRRSFEDKYGRDIELDAMTHWSRWREHESALAA